MTGKFFDWEKYCGISGNPPHFPVMIHNKLTQQVLLWLVKLLTWNIMAEFPKTRQFNPVIIFPGKVIVNPMILSSLFLLKIKRWITTLRLYNLLVMIYP